MNGYTILSDSYKLLLEQGKIDKETAKKAIRIYDFLATCDEDDFCEMVDSTAFNEIISAYSYIAVKYADIDEESKKKVLQQFPWIFDEKNAKEALAIYQKKN